MVDLMISLWDISGGFTIVDDSVCLMQYTNTTEGDVGGAPCSQHLMFNLLETLVTQLTMN